MSYTVVRKLEYSKGEEEVLKLLILGSSLKDIAAQLNKSYGAIKIRMNRVRERNNLATTQEMMFILGESKQLTSSTKDYEFPLGI